MSETFPCNACGGPNEPAAGVIRMACTYCGANLTIPENLRRKQQPAAQVKPKATGSTSSFIKEAPDLLNKVQPFAIKAWKTYAAWTWIRWLLPACLSMLAIGFFICVLIGAVPIVLRLLR
ncbi:MAG: hypothetical protein IPP55_19790 [Anaerolineales bacterium]|nr:hypothetical protein [Anaerolineales bacterium]